MANTDNYYDLRYRVGQSNKDIFSKLKKDADEGNAEAQYELALYYRYSRKISSSDELFIHYLKLAAAQGFTSAEYRLGFFYEEMNVSEESPPDYEKAAQYYQLAADKDHSLAQLALGYLYREGLGVEQSYEKAFGLFKKAADNDDEDAFLLVARCYELSQGVSQSLEKADEYYALGLEYAKKNHIDILQDSADSSLSLVKTLNKASPITEKQSKYFEYLMLKGFRNLQLVFLYYKAKAIFGDRQALLRVAECYRDGLGVKQSYEIAQQYLRLVTEYDKQIIAKDITSGNIGDLSTFTLREKADQDDAEAQYQIAWHFKEGHGVAQSFELFRHYLHLAAHHGHRDALLALGWFYNCGDAGFPWNAEKAFEYYQKAADQGDASAQCYIAGFLQSRHLYEEAFSYYKKAADQGNGFALGMLGSFYEKGLGIPQSDELAECYLKLCANAPFSEEKAMARIEYAQSLDSENPNFLEECILQAVIQYSSRAMFGDLHAKRKLVKLLRNSQSAQRFLQKIFNLYLSLSEENDTEALRWLGFFYEKNIVAGEEEPAKIAFDYYTKASELGDACALGCLGRCFENGFGVKKSERQAKHYYQLCLNAHWNLNKDLSDLTYGFGHIQKFIYFCAKSYFDDSEGLYNIGLCYKTGDSVPQSYDMALQYFQRAAAQGHRDAQFEAGEILDFQKFDFNNAAKFYQQASLQKHPRALSYLGYFFQYGLGVPQSWDQAIKYYKQAVEQSDLCGLALLERCYLKSTFRSSFEAAHHYYNLRSNLLKSNPHNSRRNLIARTELQAEKNDVGAQLLLGMLIHRGFLLNETEEKAIDFLQQAAIHDHPIALMILDSIQKADTAFTEVETETVASYVTELFHSLQKNEINNLPSHINAQVTEINDLDLDEMNFSELKLVADRGFSEAQYKVAKAYEEGIAVEHSPEQAVRYYKLAADQGNKEAQSEIAWLYDLGYWMPKSYSTASYYHKLCGEQGNNISLTRLGYLHELGLGVELSNEKAFTYYLKAAENGYRFAQGLLAECYEFGKGVTASNELAQHYYQLYVKNQNYRLDADKWERDCVSCLNLQEIYFFYLHEVFIHYKARAISGDKNALLKIAQYYREGWGVEKSSELSKYYSELASKKEKPNFETVCSDSPNKTKIEAYRGNAEALFQLATGFQDVSKERYLSYLQLVVSPQTHPGNV